MTRIGVIATAASLAAVAACDRGGTSTQDVRRAAVDKARAELGLAGDVPLEATVWTGRPFNDQLTVCGTVSSAGGQQVRPQRFIATTDPLHWLAFEDAHNQAVSSQPDKFPDWSQVCGVGAKN